MYCISMKKSGSELRKAIMTAKKDTTGDSLRGIEYQLLNALSVKNTEKLKTAIKQTEEKKMFLKELFGFEL